MSDTSERTGILPAIIACVLAILGIFTIGILFIPLAAIVGAIATYLAFSGKNLGGIGLSVLAWLLTIAGFILSPSLLLLLGLGTRAN